MEKRREGSLFFVFLLVSALLMLLLSTSSPLYPTNPWVDANCYVTVGRGMREGLVPYRDLVDHKGPLLYGLHWLAALVHPNGFLGVYLLETLACALFMLAAWKMLRLYVNRSYAAILMLGVAAVRVASVSFSYGDSAEEMCTPLMAWSLYEALRYFRDENRRMSAGSLICNGILAGCVLWIKYSLLGLHFAWMAVIAIESVVRERKIWPAAKMCLLFLLGMGISTLPWLVYFGVNGAIGDWFDVYFVMNLTEYKKTQGLAYTLFQCVIGGSAQNPISGLLLLLAVWNLILKPKAETGLWERICLGAMAVCSILLVCFGRQVYHYTYYAYTAYVPLGLVPVIRFLEKRLPSERERRRAMAVITACACVLAVATDEMISRIGYDREELVQTQFAREMNAVEHPTVLNCAFQDGGFYLAADTHPTQKWFVNLNMAEDRVLAAHREVVEAGAVDFVITQNRTLEDYGIDGARYELALERTDAYPRKKDREKYYLYRRLDVPAEIKPGEKGEPQNF